MLISDLLKHKGAAVVTISPGATITDVLATLAEHRIGALVVLDGERLAGIISERDIVRRLHERGPDALSAEVHDLMTSPVVSCTPRDAVEQVAGLMTENRFRHMPVVDEGRLVGIVTIGDVVAGRIRQLEQDRGQLEEYITRGA